MVTVPAASTRWATKPSVARQVSARTQVRAGPGRKNSFRNQGLMQDRPVLNRRARIPSPTSGERDNTAPSQCEPHPGPNRGQLGSCLLVDALITAKATLVKSFEGDR